MYVGGAEEPKGKGPTFVGKPRIIPKDGGAIIVMECRVKTPSRPTAVWWKGPEAIKDGGRFKVVFVEEPDNVYLCQLEIRVSAPVQYAMYRKSLLQILYLS